MPIANCIIKKHKSYNTTFELVKTLSDELNVPIEDITINFMVSDSQVGHQYDCMIYLYLPSLWSSEDVKRIEAAFVNAICGYLNLTNESVFLITSIVNSGNVVSNGEIEEW